MTTTTTAMSTGSWVPHGIIEYEGAEPFYRSAKTSVDQYGNIKNPLKHHITRFFGYLFNKFIFDDIRYDVSFQELPAEGSSKAVDMVISDLVPAPEWKALCFIETEAAADSDLDRRIRQLELRAIECCREYFAANPKMTQVDVLTLVGASVRCWTARNLDGEELRGFWDEDVKGTYEAYLDVGLDRNRDVLLDFFNKIKTVPLLNATSGIDH